MKRLFRLLTCLLVAMSLVVPIVSSANYTGNLSDKKITLNEYEIMEQLSKESDEGLISLGYSSTDVSKIKDYKEVFRSHIEELCNLSDNALINNGYTKEQIYIIRNFSGTEDEMRAVAASVSVSASVTSHYYDGNYTYAKLVYSWLWSGVPAFKSFDVIGASWNDWFITSKSLTVKYYDKDTGAYHSTISPTFIGANLGTEGGGYRFRLATSDNFNYGKVGSGFYNLRSDVHAAKDIAYYISYGHSQIVVSSPSISIGTGGASGSISFSFGTVEADSVYGTRKL